MATVSLRQETYLPEDGEQVAEIYDFLTAHEATGRGRPTYRYFISVTEPGDRTELPAELCQLLRQAVEALQRGLAVTVVPQTTTMTTQDAADVLGISRPTLIKLLDDHKIPYERVGTHRKILLRDLLEYRERRRAEQYAALEATAVSVDDEEDVEAMLERLRVARRAVARRRRSSPET